MLAHSLEGGAAPPARRSRSWFDAWVESAYGADGFWRVHNPEAHFRTAAASGPMVAEMLATLVDRQEGVKTVVDVGAGSGRLLEELAAIRPDLRLVGIDLRTRPAGLPAQVDWAQDLWDVRYGCWTSGEAGVVLDQDEPLMIICCEWLDDLPCPVVVRHVDGWREVIISDDGLEQPGPRLESEELAWADRWWPGGDRAEIGLTRDRAWAELIKPIRRRGGCVLMIDYGHLARQRPVTGSLAAYRDGRALEPAVGSSVNLTAHVAVDAVRAVGETLGATTAFCGLQSEVIPDLLQLETYPDPLFDLGRRSRLAALSSHYVWGSHWWLLQC
jgi:putative S-adenosyl-L-methionine-dependent methyltransferase